MMNLITKPQTDALATLAATLRPDGATRWDPAGIRAVIAHIRDDNDLADICHATINLALDPKATTPGLLRHDGPHWPTATGPQRPTFVPDRYVPPPAITNGPDINRRGAAACRAALQAAKTPGDLMDRSDPLGTRLPEGTDREKATT